MNAVKFLLQQNYIETQINKQLDLALSVHGVSFTEFIVLHYLREASENKLSRIALGNKVGLSPSGITRLLLPLEKTGIVKRDINPRDARQSLIVLTENGEELTKEATKTIEHVSGEIFAFLTDEEISTLSSLLGKLKL
ncbi:MarR family winged helix-turn-helix transcriptional regulator [Ignatzschineria sp. LJL83]